jgi:hypothetical protein
VISSHFSFLRLQSLLARKNQLKIRNIIYNRNSLTFNYSFTDNLNTLSTFIFRCIMPLKISIKKHDKNLIKLIIII